MADATHARDMVDRERLPIWPIIGATFRTFAQAPLLFLAYGAVAQLGTIWRLTRFPPEPGRFDPKQLITYGVGLLIAVLVQTTMTYSAVRLRAREPFSIGEGLSLGVRRYLPVLGLTVLVILAVYAGMLLLIVPGVILAVVWSVAVPACVIEAAGPIASFKRSAFLTRGERWRIFGLYCIFFAPLILLTVVTMTLALKGQLATKGHLATAGWIGAAFQVFWAPLATIFAAAIYVELRRLKENVGVVRVFD